MDEKNTETPLSQIDALTSVQESKKPARPNKEFWRKVHARVNQAEPTVDNLINAMCDEGNRIYMESFGFDPKQIEKPMPPNDTRHEIAHICAKIPHTPQMEYGQLAFQYGLILGVRATQRTDRDLLIKREQYKFNKQLFKEENETRYGITNQDPQEKNSIKHEPLSARDTAVYVAAGMYMREKIDEFLKQRTKEQTYNDQKEWNEQWAKRDEKPIIQADYQPSYDDTNYFKQIKTAPANILDISKDEWKAIIATATNQPLPEGCAFPKRMEAVKEALVKTNMLFDRPKFVEELKKKEAQKRETAAPSQQWER